MSAETIAAASSQIAKAIVAARARGKFVYITADGSIVAMDRPKKEPKK